MRENTKSQSKARRREGKQTSETASSRAPFTEPIRREGGRRHGGAGLRTQGETVTATLHSPVSAASSVLWANNSSRSDSGGHRGRGEEVGSGVDRRRSEMPQRTAGAAAGPWGVSARSHGPLLTAAPLSGSAGGGGAGAPEEGSCARESEVDRFPAAAGSRAEGPSASGRSRGAEAAPPRGRRGARRCITLRSCAQRLLTR